MTIQHIISSEQEKFLEKFGIFYLRNENYTQKIQDFLQESNTRVLKSFIEELKGEIGEDEWIPVYEAYEDKQAYWEAQSQQSALNQERQRIKSLLEEALNNLK